MGPGPRLSLLALGAGVALLVAAASASSTTPPAALAGAQGESQGGGTLRLMWGIEPDVDPALATGLVGSWAILNATCAKLFRTVHDPDTGEPRVVSEVVRKHTVSNGSRTHTFDLERTFRFHTGKPVTARSFALAFHRDANPLMKSPAARLGFMEPIVGADAAMEGKAQTVSGVQVLGRYRLRILLKRRTGDFRARLTMPYFCPILPGTPPAEIDDPPGSGPYYLDPEERVVNRRIVLERNLYYPRGVRTATPDRIVWTIEDDQLEKVRATEQGKNDFTPLFAWREAIVRGLVAKYDVDRPGAQVLRDFPTLSSFVFRFNLRRPAFEGSGQAPLRKAINYALSRPALTSAQGYLAGRPSDRLLPAAIRESRRLYPLRGPDPDTARRLASRAGNPTPPLTLYMPASYPFSVPVAQVFVANLKQLGIEVEPKYYELRTLQQKLATQGEPWDVAWSTLGAPYPDPAGALVPLLRGTEYETRVNAANRLTGAAARASAWAELEADLMRNDPPVAAYADFTPLAFVSRRNFGCWSGADAYIDLATVCTK